MRVPPNPGPRVRIAPNQEQFQRAPRVNTDPVFRGVQQVAGTVAQIGEEQERERLKAEAEEQRFQSIRKAQDASIAGRRALHDAWGEISKLGGIDAETQAVPRMRAALDDQLRALEDMDDRAAKLSARSNLLQTFGTLNSKAEALRMRGREESILNTFQGETNIAIDELVMDPENPEVWKKLDKAVGVPAKQLGWTNGKIDSELKALRATAAQAIVDDMMARAQTPDDFKKAKKWVSTHLRYFLDKEKAVSRVERRRDIFAREMIEKQTNEDNELLAEGAMVRARQGDVAWRQWLEDNESNLNTADARQAVAGGLVALNESDRRKAEKEDLEKEQLMYWQLRETGKAPKTLAGFRALGITDNVGLITWALGEEEGKRIAKEEASAFESAVNDFTENGYDAFTVENLTQKHGMSPEAAGRLVSLKLTDARGKRERLLIEAEREKAARQKYNSNVTMAKGIKARLDKYKSIAEMDRDLSLAADMSGLDPWAKAWVEGAQKITRMNLEPAPPAYAATLKRYTVGDKDNDPLTLQILERLDLDEETERTMVAAWGDLALAHMKALEAKSDKGVTAGPQEIIDYFNTTIGELKSSMDAKTAWETLINAGVNAGVISGDGKDAEEIEKLLGEGKYVEVDDLILTPKGMRAPESSLFRDDPPEDYDPYPNFTPGAQ